APVTDVQNVAQEHWNVVDAPEVVRAVEIGDVRLSAENVQRRRVQRLEQRFLQVHAGNGAATARIEDAAVHDDDGLDAGIPGDLESLQATAAITGDGDRLGIDLVEIQALRIVVLLQCPVEPRQEIGGARGRRR